MSAANDDNETIDFLLENLPNVVDDEQVTHPLFMEYIKILK